VWNANSQAKFRLLNLTLDVLILDIRVAAPGGFVMLCYSLASKLLRKVYHCDGLGHKAQNGVKNFLFHSSLSNRSQVGHQISRIILTCAFSLCISGVAQK
jgi:hypothetical protein